MVPVAIGHKMEYLTVYEIIVVAAALIGTYVKMNTEINKLKSRIFVLEQSNGDIISMLKEVSKDLNEIKLLLARKQLDQ